MEIRKAHLVEATAGREKGKLLYVLDTDGEFLLLADGKSRRVEAPKRKKSKHVRFVAEPDSRVAEKIRAGERITNSELRKAVASYRGGSGEAAQENNSDQEG